MAWSGNCTLEIGSRQGALHVFFSSCRHTVRAARQGGFASAQCAIISALMRLGFGGGGGGGGAD